MLNNIKINPNITQQQTPPLIHYWGINSFQNTKGYKQLPEAKSWAKMISTTSSKLSAGLYVLNINYNIEPDYKPEFRVKIGADSKRESPAFKRGFVAFYVRSAINKPEVIIEYKYTCPDEACPLYIKNLGIYPVGDLSTGVDEEVSVANISAKCIEKLKEIDENIVFLDEVNNYEKLYTGIIFPAVCCFKETKNGGNEVGCLDTVFSGFQELPRYAYQRCAAVYEFDEDYNCAHAMNSRFADNDENFQSLIRSQIEKQVVREKQHD